ncbi:MAG: rhodanese-like domain-containing protein [Candidatus Marinimicrobia bacterium]|nr:rhodanese-like domain-containing protein [Candidatus Neomarinimicrobiota bacterium]
MKLNKLFIILFAATFLFFIGCDEEDDINEFEILVEYLEGDDGGYINNMGTFYVKYADINTDDYFVLDLRGVDDYNTYHIQDAFNATLGTMFDVIEDNNTSGKTVLTVCYSGQSASFAQAILNIKDIPAKLLLFGMSSVRVENDVWTGNCHNKVEMGADSVNWVYTASGSLLSFDYPTLDTGEEEAEDILDARIDAAIAAWGDGLLVAGSDILTDPVGYNIINYWGTTDAYHTGNPYETLGHFDGALQMTPGTLTMDGNLSAFDPAGGNIFYCWTGQTAAAALAYLNIVGYETKSVKYGVNSMIWDKLGGHKWSKPY